MITTCNTCDMQPADIDVSRRFLHAFWAVRQRVEARVGAPLRRELGIDLTDIVLLEYAAMTDLSPTEIAAAVRLPEHGVSRRLGALEHAGLLHRRLDPKDARRRRLVLTGAGRARLSDARTAVHQRLAPILGELGPARLAALLDALTALAAADDTAADDASAGESDHDEVVSSGAVATPPQERPAPAHA